MIEVFPGEVLWSSLSLLWVFLAEMSGVVELGELHFYQTTVFFFPQRYSALSSRSQAIAYRE